MVTELPGNEREDTASLILNLALAAAVLPLGIGIGALFLLQIGVIDWWTTYGVVLIGDGRTLPLSIQALIVAGIASAAGLAAALWAGVEKFYQRAMLNLAITGLSLVILLAIAR